MAQPEVSVSGVSVSARIPEFWTDLPRHWFIQAEAVLHPQKMSDEAKFQFVISKLGKDVIQQVTDILVKQPENGKYDTLKTRLLDIYEESENRKVQKLISEMELGDQKPSQLLRKMQELASGKVTDETLTILWQNHLPGWVRGILTASGLSDINALARMADKVTENAMPIQGVAAVRSARSDSPDVIAEIHKLGERLRKIENSQRSGGRSRSRSHGAPRTRNTSGSRKRTPADPDWLCYYHYKFRARAHKCVQPCTWKTSNQPTGSAEN
ncbi:uncharacterized protein LOC128198959 [Bicyclus anynana]|uniref:Uncharacterized protein LOC128198875 n=2 Tax=Bicyclus anynana TaxID=110368 RepID=A0ABM3LTC1_BICAN|nr:uncharacterized protein LOC128198875 [Bicyclus anynana]XP_052742926.1 uncharacterized protein LOC128198959 [Bicyclus anynana]